MSAVAKFKAFNTPGPWFVLPVDDLASFITIANADHDGVCAIPIVGVTDIDNRAAHDAQAIAALPDLLEAAELALKAMEDFPSLGAVGEARHRLQRAIWSALGMTPPN